jgi:hypothetical protein
MAFLELDLQFTKHRNFSHRKNAILFQVCKKIKMTSQEIPEQKSISLSLTNSLMNFLFKKRNFLFAFVSRIVNLGILELLST